MVHQGVDGLRQHSNCGQAVTAEASRRPHERHVHGAQDFRVAMAVLFHPDCYRRLRILTESADPNHGPVSYTHLDVYKRQVMYCAVGQARNPHLPSEQRDWFWWSRNRKAIPDGKSPALENR